MTETKTITVTQAHIAAGRPRCCTLCPIALAIRAAFSAMDVVVSGGSVVVKVPDRKPLYIWLPYSVIQFIAHFDRDKKVEPLTFDIEMSQPAGDA